MALDPRLLDDPRLPGGQGPAATTSVTRTALYNPRLQRRYEVRDGIPVMLIDEAVAVDDAEHEAIMAASAPRASTPTFA